MNTYRIEHVFDRLEVLEKRIEALYAFFSEVFDTNAEAKDLFEHLKDEEASHAVAVQYQKRMIKNDKSLQVSIEFNLTEVENIIKFIDKSLKEGKKPTLKAAVNLAAKIEGSAAEAHYQEAIALIPKFGPELAELVRHLGTADREHYKRLKDFIVNKDV